MTEYAKGRYRIVRSDKEIEKMFDRYDRAMLEKRKAYKFMIWILDSKGLELQKPLHNLYVLGRMCPSGRDVECDEILEVNSK